MIRCTDRVKVNNQKKWYVDRLSKLVISEGKSLLKTKFMNHRWFWSETKKIKTDVIKSIIKTTSCKLEIGNPPKVTWPINKRMRVLIKLVHHWQWKDCYYCAHICCIGFGFLNKNLKSKLSQPIITCDFLRAITARFKSYRRTLFIFCLWLKEENCSKEDSGVGGPYTAWVFKLIF